MLAVPDHRRVSLLLIINRSLPLLMLIVNRNILGSKRLYDVPTRYREVVLTLSNFDFLNSFGVTPVQRLKARWKELDSEKPSR